MIRPLLVGELNPYGGNPRHALFPYPETGSGGRLCYKILGMNRLQYMSTFDRVNLCAGKWSSKTARQTANEIILGDRALIVLLGAKVATAFGFKFEPFHVYRSPVCCTFVMLPHPSGLCRIWNDPTSIRKARVTMVNAGIKLDWRNS